VVKRVQTN
jgi:hypothetical protein